MELLKECLERACYSCSSHKSCLMEKQMEKDLDTDIVKYYKALFKQQLETERKSKTP